METVKRETVNEGQLEYHPDEVAHDADSPVTSDDLVQSTQANSAQSQRGQESVAREFCVELQKG